MSSSDPFAGSSPIRGGGDEVKARFVTLGDGARQVMSVEGLLLAVEESAKYPGNLVFRMATRDEIVAVGGNTFLNDKIKEVGALYRIVFTGVARSKKGRNYKTFEVHYVSKAEVDAKGHAALYYDPSTVVADPTEGDDTLPF